MKSLFLLSLKDKEFKEGFVKKILSSHANAVKFYPVLPKGEEKEHFAFSYEEGLSLYIKDENAFFEKVLAKYDELVCKHDFVLVLGLCKVGFLNEVHFSINLAKTLNTPFVLLACKECKEDLHAYVKAKLKGDFAILCDENDELPCLKPYEFNTPARFFYSLNKQLLKERKSVVLPESNDVRILKAADFLLKKDLIDLILLGDKDTVLNEAKKHGLCLEKATFMDPANSSLHDEFANTLHELRKNKGVDLEKAKEMVKDRTYFGTMLVHTNKAHAMVSGASTTTAETVRPALQIIKTKPGVSSVSGVFFMCLEDEVLVFADCAVNTNPDAKTLAGIASVSADTAKAFGLDPRVGILSYSTGESGSGVSVDATKEVLKELRSGEYGDFSFDGPLQFDAAIDPKTAASKMPGSAVAGKANVFIFPDLNAANICYKAVQRTAGAIAVGPALQGLKKPVNDLSRGCLVEDVILTVILSAVQAG